MGPRREPGDGIDSARKLRGPVSGLLQSGYPSGYFVASLVYFLLFDTIGWRGMFMVGVAPALLVLLIRMHVKESPAFEARRGNAAASIRWSSSSATGRSRSTSWC